MGMARFRRSSSLLADFHERTPEYVWYVYMLVLVWGFGDVVSTFFATAATGGAAQELNPLVRFMLANEPLLVPVLKAGVVLYAGVVLLACRDLVETVPGWRVWFATVVTAGSLVVLNNTIVGITALV